MGSELTAVTMKNRNLLTFQRHISPPSSGLKNLPSKNIKKESTYSSIRKMELIGSSETLVDLYRNIQSLNSEYLALRLYSCYILSYDTKYYESCR